MLTWLTTSLASSLFGSISALVTGWMNNKHELAAKGLSIQQDLNDKAHELAMVDKQAAIAKIQTDGDATKAEIDLDAKIQGYTTQLALSENPVVAIMNGCIRPVSTAAFLIVFFYVLIKTICFITTTNLPVTEWFGLEIFIVFFDTFSFIMNYWFTARGMRKYGSVR